MMIDVEPRPVPEKVWWWDGSAEQAAELSAYFDGLGRSVGITTWFTDNGDDTGWVENDTYMYGTNRYPVEAGRWYRTWPNWGGVEPIPTSEAEVNFLYRPSPEYPPVFEDVGSSEPDYRPMGQ